MFIEKQWSLLKVGDIARVAKDTEFPADMLLLGSIREIVYVDTMNLDGETNLKEKFVFNKEFNQQNISRFLGSVVCDMPNASLDDWDGNIHIEAPTSAVINCR